MGKKGCGTFDKATPCGGCRQYLREFSSGALEVIGHGESGEEPEIKTLGELLPDSFGPEHLLSAEVLAAVRKRVVSD